MIRTTCSVHVRVLLFFCLACGAAVRSEPAERPGKSSKVNPGADPRYPLRPDVAHEERTKIAILATPHLTTLGAKFESRQLDALIESLALFKPNVIAVEQMPSELVAHMVHFDDTYGGVVSQFANDRARLGKLAQETLGATWEEARDKTAELLGSQGSEGASAMPVEMRLQPINHMVAAFDLDSAVLQWSYLSESQRKADASLAPDIRSKLEAGLSSANEVSSIGIRLARTLGLQRIHFIDDFQVGPSLMRIAPVLIAEVRDNPAYAKAASAPLYKEFQQRLDECAVGGDLLPCYVYLNSPDYASADVETQWGAFYRTKLESKLDRTRVALWEVRNLLMAAHVRAATAAIPGGRALVIVGAGHKPFLDAYLGQLSDIEVVDVGRLLQRHQPD